mmetsp:Transcript_25621/g.38282  ORF Transcript_25621/g.38282 Transcript_25621/m.38282 type:complete len:488 (-) Transcript_25621:197-1660(-)|eukprot:CAMPEP_0116016786 /NCGR_PEP_ID=MMETSP0321-20121206/7680_1 /TAXON_ID=163516 /ORGANISM="Leptocylindrus danicus var. danicus, Strain B650" /LENGTH=487 /DNA_ID=CAMNT_0003486895 /DNA_START=703 /DNA_END=2166 /DNA_ORIENTATION=-
MNTTQTTTATTTVVQTNQTLNPPSTNTSNNTPSNSRAVNKWSRNGYGSTPTATGKFSPEESGIIRDAILRFCEARSIEPARLCSECEHKAELKGAWMEIAKCLPMRSVQAVYRHGLRQLHPFKRGPWSEEECMQLLELVARVGKKWALIQAKMNRSADSCRDKHREIGQNAEFVRGRWTPVEQELLIRVVWEFCVRTYPNAVLLRALDLHSDADEYSTTVTVDHVDASSTTAAHYQEVGDVHHVSTEEVVVVEGDAFTSAANLVADIFPPNLNLKKLGKIVEDYGKAGTIPWSNISRRMGNRSRLSCFKKWQKLIGVVKSDRPADRVLSGTTVSKSILAQVSQETNVSNRHEECVVAQAVATVNANLDAEIQGLMSNPPALDVSIAERQRQWAQEKAASSTAADIDFASLQQHAQAITDEDFVLLDQLIRLQMHNSDEIAWDALVHSQGAFARWVQITAEEGVDYRRSVYDSAKEIMARWKMGLHLV